MLLNIANISITDPAFGNISRPYLPVVFPYGRCVDIRLAVIITTNVTFHTADCRVLSIISGLRGQRLSMSGSVGLSSQLPHDPEGTRPPVATCRAHYYDSSVEKSVVLCSSLSHIFI